ncbi:Na(+)-translocating NADH-quinone reductase subunit A [Flavobacterium cyclinae]|uniref:Na(+)-translocating NADH-quinone reductase subunit A n=1 Tax=Flavobacterium cyclinae TaxID=2895947 RepID=UPI001E5173EC|nr:Na(+)-translocating NADH-quinone reductase subunit A [Flavobacterium cyclinae]UGS21499.1 Na(+)-translocating NADH-quinone reductase subunit A [Flavobacterium cyclinae]
MSKDIRIKKGLDLKLKGEAAHKVAEVTRSKVYAVKPSDFHGVTPKMVVKEGDNVKAGEVIFYSKADEKVKFVAPVSGKIQEIKRGEKRVILEILIAADSQDVFVEHSKKNPNDLSTEEVKAHLLASGCWPFINQRPYDVIANSADTPKAIFISAYATAPLEADVEFVLESKMEAFKVGIEALTKLTSGKVHLSLKGKGKSIFSEVKGVALHKVYGPHPAGNVGVQIEKIDPICAGERVWTVAPQDVAIIGELFLTGKLNLTRTIALAGSEVKEPQYYNVVAGASIADVVANNINGDNVRIISGNVLTGKKVTSNGFLGFYSNVVTVIPEGNTYRMFGWMPFASPSIHSASRTGLSWLMPGKKYAPNTNLNGEERALVVTGEMESVMPMDIYPMQLLKACLASDIDKMESLGIYEVAPEDFALIDYTNTSKLEAQEIIRGALDLMIKEVG